MINTYINIENLWNDNMTGSKEDRPENKCILLEGKRGRIFCTYFMAAGSGKHPTVIFCHGFPGNEENMDIVHALRRIGFHVMTFHYSGSWGSDGDFGLLNCLEDTECVLDLLLSDKSLHADPDNLFIFGQSMGGFIVYHTLIKRTELKAGILVMPCDFALLAEMSRTDKEMHALFIDVLSEGADWLKGTSVKMLYQESMELAKDRTFTKLAEEASSRNMLVIGGTLDTICPPVHLIGPWVQSIQSMKKNKLQYMELPTDHMFADARCTVTEKVAAYFKSFI